MTEAGAVKDPERCPRRTDRGGGVMDRVNRRCATCKFWFNGGPGADTCMKKLTSIQIRVIEELPASYTVLCGQVHANNGQQCKQWEKK